MVMLVKINREYIIYFTCPYGISIKFLFRRIYRYHNNYSRNAIKPLLTDDRFKCFFFLSKYMTMLQTNMNEIRNAFEGC